MKKTAIFFGSSGGVTEGVAKQIARKIGTEVKVFDVATTSIPEAGNYTNLIFGTSTWGLGDLQDDWDEVLKELSDTDLNGKSVALFGVGDCEMYPDTFVDGMGIIYEEIKSSGCNFVGQTEADGYSFDESRACKDGKFVGLAIDEDNESEQTEERINNWLEGVVPAFK